MADDLYPFVYLGHRGDLKDLDGEELVVAITTSAYDAQPTDATMADITGESTGDGYARAQFTAVWDDVDGLLIHPDDQWPSIDLSDETDVARAVVGHGTLGDTDSDITLVSQIPYEPHHGTSAWIFAPTRGIGRPADARDLESRVEALEAASTGGTPTEGSTSGPRVLRHIDAIPTGSPVTEITHTDGLLDYDLVVVQRGEDRAKVLLPNPDDTLYQELKIVIGGGWDGGRAGPSIGWLVGAAPGVLGDFVSVLSDAIGPFDLTAGHDLVLDYNGSPFTVTLNDDYSGDPSPEQSVLQAILGGIVGELGSSVEVLSPSPPDYVDTHRDLVGGRNLFVSAAVTGGDTPSLSIVSSGGIDFADLDGSNDVIGVRAITESTGMPAYYRGLGVGAPGNSSQGFPPGSGNHAWNDYAVDVVQSMSLVAVPNAWTATHVIPRAEYVPHVIDPAITIDDSSQNVGALIIEAFERLTALDGAANPFAGVLVPDQDGDPVRITAHDNGDGTATLETEPA